MTFWPCFKASCRKIIERSGGVIASFFVPHRFEITVSHIATQVTSRAFESFKNACRNFPRAASVGPRIAAPPASIATFRGQTPPSSDRQSVPSHGIAVLTWDHHVMTSRSNRITRLHLLAAATAVALTGLAAPAFAGQVYLGNLKNEGNQQFIVKYKSGSAPAASPASMSASLRQATSTAAMPAAGKRPTLRALRQMII